MSAFQDTLQEIKQLATAIGVDVKDIFQNQGHLPSLQTSDKNSLVQAINEVVSKPIQNNVFMEDFLNMQYRQPGPAFGAIRAHSVALIDDNQQRWRLIDPREASRSVYFALEIPTRAIKEMALNWIKWACAHYDMANHVVFDHYVSESGQQVLTTVDSLYVFAPHSSQFMASTGMLVAAIDRYAGLFGKEDLPVNYIAIVENFIEANGFNYITNPGNGAATHDTRIWEDATKQKRRLSTATEVYVGYLAASSLLGATYPNPFNEWHFVYAWTLTSQGTEFWNPEYFHYDNALGTMEAYVSFNGAGTAISGNLNPFLTTDDLIAEDIRDLTWPLLFGIQRDYDSWLTINLAGSLAWQFGRVVYTEANSMTTKRGIPTASTPHVARVFVDKGRMRKSTSGSLVPPTRCVRLALTTAPTRAGLQSWLLPWLNATSRRSKMVVDGNTHLTRWHGCYECLTSFYQLGHPQGRRVPHRGCQLLLCWRPNRWCHTTW